MWKTPIGTENFERGVPDGLREDCLTIPEENWYNTMILCMKVR